MEMYHKVTSVNVVDVKNLISKDVPIRVMSRKLCLPLSTTYYIVRKINPKFHLIEKPSLNFKNVEDFGEVLGVFSGDGSLVGSYYYDIVITIGRRENYYLKNLVRFLTCVFGKEPWLYDEIKEGVIRVRYRSKLIFNFFKENLSWKGKKTKDVHLKQRIKNKSFGIGFLRGLIDTDGHVEKDRVIFSTISRKLTKDIEFYLHKLGIDFRTRLQEDKRKHQSDIFRIEVKRYHVSKFLKLVKPRKFNGVVV